MLVFTNPRYIDQLFLGPKFIFMKMYLGVDIVDKLICIY